MITSANLTAAVLVVNYRSTDRVIDLMGDLAASSTASSAHHVSIVDNSVDPHEFRKLSERLQPFRHRFASLSVVAAEENRGYAAGNNLAYAQVQHLAVDVVVVINPDIRIVNGDIGQAAKLTLDLKAPIVVPFTKNNNIWGDGRAAISLLSGRSRQLAADEVPSRLWLVYPGGHFFIINRSAWDRSGGLSEHFFLYSEEADLILRLRATDTSLMPDPNLMVEHDSGGTTGSQHGQKSRVTLFHASRSSIVLFRSHRRLRWFLPSVFIARLGWVAAVTIRLGFGAGGTALRGALDGLFGPLGPYYRRLIEQR